MTYKRVVPRDLFNEGNLLKCYGQLYLNLEKMGLEDKLIHAFDDQPFDIHQSYEDGSLHITNVQLQIRGELVTLRRPLNSRLPYPLWCYPDEDSEEIQVFHDDGSFTDEFKTFLRAES